MGRLLWWDEGKWDVGHSGVSFHRNKAFYSISSSHVRVLENSISYNVSRSPFPLATSLYMKSSPQITMYFMFSKYLVKITSYLALARLAQLLERWPMHWIQRMHFSHIDVSLSPPLPLPSIFSKKEISGKNISRWRLTKKIMIIITSCFNLYLFDYQWSEIFLSFFQYLFERNMNKILSLFYSNYW